MNEMFTPYCGHPPVPGTLSWTLDPVLISSLLGLAFVYGLRARATQSSHRLRPALFAAGLLLTAGALMSPLCNLSVALFSARVSQHLILTLIAAPLLALGLPQLLSRNSEKRPMRPFSTAAVGTVLFAAAIWVWHMPGPYDATLQNNIIYWVMHLTSISAALIFWYGLFFEDAAHAGRAMMAAFITAMHMSLLGAILTFAKSPWFAVHAATTWPWGLSPLEDQQLGGLIMWVPAGLLFTVYAIAAFAIWLNRLPGEVNSTVPVRSA